MGALTLEVSKVGLLVEAGALETERVDDVVDLDDLILEGLLSLLGGGVGANVWDTLVLVDAESTANIAGASAF